MGVFVYEKFRFRVYTGCYRLNVCGFKIYKVQFWVLTVRGEFFRGWFFVGRFSIFIGEVLGGFVFVIFFVM